MHNNSSAETEHNNIKSYETSHSFRGGVLIKKYIEIIKKYAVFVIIPFFVISALRVTFLYADEYYMQKTDQKVLTTLSQAYPNVVDANSDKLDDALAKISYNNKENQKLISKQKKTIDDQEKIIQELKASEQKTTDINELKNTILELQDTVNTLQQENERLTNENAELIASLNSLRQEPTQAPATPSISGQIANSLESDGLPSDLKIEFNHEIETDSTKYATVTTTTSIDQYAYNYFKKYFTESDKVHYVNNTTLNENYEIKAEGNELSVKVSHHNENTDDSSIAEGSVSEEEYTERYVFNIETGNPLYEDNSTSENDLTSDESGTDTESIGNSAEDSDSIVTIEDNDSIIIWNINIDSEGLSEDDLYAEMISKATNAVYAIIETKNIQNSQYEGIKINFGSYGYIYLPISEILFNENEAIFYIDETMIENY